MLLLRNGKVQAKYKDDLKKKMLYFSNVDIIEPTGIKWSSIRFQRNNQTYRMLVSICQLIIEGMLITTDAGDYRLASFVDEQRMCRLYEKFILEYYTRHYPALSVSASQIPWSLDDGVGIMLPVMQSDIHLQRGNTVLIIDAKYYSHTTQVQFDKHTLHSNNLYQIFTYVKNRSYQFGEKENTVSGMLLYAKTEEEIQPDNVYQMHGSQISVKTLDLNLPFAEIASQMDRIVETHFHGTGYQYRQSFLRGEIDYRKYDDIFPVAAVQEDLDIVWEILAGRMLMPYGVSDFAWMQYEGYIKQNQCEMMNYLKEEDQMPFINLMAEKNYFSKEGIEAAIDWASRKQKTELLSILMNEQHKRFPKKKKTFEL